MANTDPTQWTTEDVNNILAAFGVLQEYGLDTTSPSMHFSGLLERVPATVLGDEDQTDQIGTG